MSRMIKIPLLGIETNVSDNPTEQEIIDAVSEASVAFCIASINEGKGILEEIELVKKDDGFDSSEFDIDLSHL